MRPLYLFLENFVCYDSTEIDFSGINSALIIGKVANSDLFSNGVGKSTIFKAISVCVFNECDKDLKFEDLVREDTLKYKIIFDFENYDGKIYRISRSRTKKGISDLSLYERNSYTENNVNPHTNHADEEFVKKFWTNISSRRASDTEETIEKIHKTNYKAFCSGNYFAQDDYNVGLATATKGGRKEMLKNSLQLVIYNSLYKLASNRAQGVFKDLDKKNAVINSMGDSNNEILKLENQLTQVNLAIGEKTKVVENDSALFTNKTNELNAVKNQHNLLSNQVESVLKRQKEISDNILNIQKSVDEYNLKKKSIVTVAKNLDAEIKSLKEDKNKLANLDFEKIIFLKVNIDTNKEILGQKNGLIKSLEEDLVELRIPLPNNGFCKHCRQPLTDVHRREYEKSSLEEISKKETKIAELKKEIPQINELIKSLNLEIKELESLKSKLSNVNVSLESKEKEIRDKKVIYTDYENILKEKNESLSQLKLDLEKVQVEVEMSSSKELEVLKKDINNKIQEVADIERRIKSNNEIINKLNNEKAVCEHSITEHKKNLNKRDELQKEVSSLEDDYSVFGDVLEAFGPTGIPNLIIHTMLDDLQIEANNILQQIRPGLQLSFSIEKTKGDGQVDDDLNINYFLNGKARNYAQLSGAQKLCVMFGLKLGTAYLLKNKLGISINMLLLDEIDRALDKASIDAFADIIKFFQKDFVILVITHNDRLQEKFNNFILVEQDQNMVSRAKVISS